MSRRAVLRKAAGIGAVTLGGFALGSGRSGEVRREPSVLVAGSLEGVASKVRPASVEAHGSLAARRLVLEGARHPDAVALADPRLFEGLTDRITLFATNALVLAIAPGTPHAGALRRDWREAIQRPGITLGRTDPRLDPLGYRTVMALELADGIDTDLVRSRTVVFPEVGLMRTLEAGRVDAAFAYRNMAVEHGVSYVELPDAIDFSEPSLADHYRTVSFDAGTRRIRGAPIRYAAAPLTDRGASWARELSGAASLLRRSGFGVPPNYPREVPVRSFDRVAPVRRRSSEGRLERRTRPPSPRTPL